MRRGIPATVAPHSEPCWWHGFALVRTAPSSSKALVTRLHSSHAWMRFGRMQRISVMLHALVLKRNSKYDINNAPSTLSTSRGVSSKHFTARWTSHGSSASAWTGRAIRQPSAPEEAFDKTVGPMLNWLHQKWDNQQERRWTFLLNALRKALVLCANGLLQKALKHVKSIQNPHTTSCVHWRL